MRRVARVAGLLAVAVAVGLAVREGVGRLSTAGGGRSGAPGDYLFLFVWEVNNAAVRGSPVSVEGGGAAGFDPEARTLLVDRREELPGPGTRALVLHRTDSLDTVLGRGVFPVARLPARIPVDRPLRRAGTVLGPSGQPVRLDDVVDDATRLLPGPLVLEAVDAGGAARLRWGDESFRLGPGDGWRVALARGPSGGVEVIRDGAAGEWERAVGEHLRGGHVLTVVRVFNYGWWPKDRVRLGDGGEW